MSSYPKMFESCPNCGSTSRVIEKETQEEIAQGNLGVGTKLAAMIVRTAIFNPNDAKLLASRQFPVVVSFFDICDDCGTVYCCEIQKGSAVAKPQMRQGGNNDFPPFPGPIPPMN